MSQTSLISNLATTTTTTTTSCFFWPALIQSRLRQSRVCTTAKLEPPGFWICVPGPFKNTLIFPLSHLKNVCIRVWKINPPFKKWKLKITVPGHIPVKPFGALSITQKTLALFKVPVWIKSRKTTRNASNQEKGDWHGILGVFRDFSKGYLQKSQDFLRYTHCTKTLYWSHHRPWYSDFYFSLFIGGVKFCITLYTRFLDVLEKKLKVF